MTAFTIDVSFFLFSYCCRFISKDNSSMNVADCGDTTLRELSASFEFCDAVTGNAFEI